MRVFLQFIILVALFFGIWYGLSRINWTGTLGVEKLTDDTEKKIGETVWELYEKTEKENKDREAIRSLDSIVSKLCVSNNIDRKKIHLHLVIKEDVNAFAMPGDHLVVYSGLIKEAANADEVAGVLAHEIAHIELDHVMKKLVSEVGLSMLLTITSGKGGGEVAKRISKLLSSTAFDRKLEKEADIKAVDYLVNAKIKPESLADFLYKLSAGKEQSGYESWLSTHPDSKERARYIIEYGKEKVKNPVPVIDSTSWKSLQERASE